MKKLANIHPGEILSTEFLEPLGIELLPIAFPRNYIFLKPEFQK